MFTLAFLDPGHFHAALVLRTRHPLLRADVRVYAQPGPELDAFLALVAAFNARDEAPTAWRPALYAGPEPLERLLAERQADAVVLAGRNDAKMATIARLHAAGIPVLADKPWVTGPESLATLEAATDGAGAALMDLMTSRHELTSRLLGRLVAAPDVFGAWDAEGGEPAIAMESVHHLAKVVNGAPLRRPAWYFDVRVQGDGIVDVPSHAADTVQRLLGGPAPDFARDVRLEAARCWATVVPGPLFAQVTGTPAFPPELAPCVQGGALHLRCNGELTYRLRGVPVRLRSEWRLEEPPGGGDLKQVRLRGTRAVLTVTQAPETGFVPRLAVRPRSDAPTLTRALERAVAAWQGDFPGLALAPGPEGAPWLEAPPALRTGHETHFAQVLDDFLRGLQAGAWPAELAAALRCKYTLLAHASGLAREASADSG